MDKLKRSKNSKTGTSGEATRIRLPRVKDLRSFARPCESATEDHSGPGRDGPTTEVVDHPDLVSAEEGYAPTPMHSPGDSEEDLTPRCKSSSGAIGRGISLLEGADNCYHQWGSIRPVAPCGQRGGGETWRSH